MIEAIYHAEGRASLQGSSYRYEYTLRDHLGNSRVMFADLNSDNAVDESEILQQNHYYPFGMNIEGNWSMGTNKYQYNGKEIDNEFGLDWYHYGFRMYDAAIGRFTGVDPISSDFPHVTTYNYAENRPIGAIDLHGLQAVDVNQRQYQEAALGGGVLAGQVSEDDLMPLYEAQATGGAIGSAVGVVGAIAIEMGVAGVAKGVVETGIEEATGIPIIADPIDIIEQGAKKLLKEGAENVAEKSAKSLKEQAVDIKDNLNNGKNSVTVKTVDGQTRYDLDGRPHGGVETPHKQVYKKNIMDGEVKSITRASKHAEPLTQQEIRAVRKFLEKQK